MLADEALNKTDPEIYNLIQQEQQRQQDHLELIASENFTSLAVMQAMGSVLTNKYAEGLPGKRYYGGCEYVDGVEQLAIDRLKQIFGCDAANVQPHSGASANVAAFMALGLQHGDTVMGQDLSHGGHLTHGSPVNFSGLNYNIVPYKVDLKTGRLDMNQVRDLAKQNKPKLIICGTSAYSRIIDFKAFREIADEVGAVVMADIAHIAGLVAAGLHPSPIPHCQIVTSTTHKTLRGPRGGIIMCQAEFEKAVNKAVFPGLQGGPLMHVIAGKAVAFKEVLAPDFKVYAQQIIANAKAMAETFMADQVDIVSGGTDNHLMMVDLRSLNLTGKEANDILDRVNITVNKNTIPDDPQSPFVTSGIRLGTPAVTTRGMKEAEMRQISKWITAVLRDPNSAPSVKSDVLGLTAQFPLYPELRALTTR